MNIARLALAAVLILLAVTVSGCAKQPGLEDEMALVIRAGKGQLSASEKDDLRKSNHPLLMQLNDPNTSKLIVMFAGLPSDSHKELLEKSYLKWPFPELDQQRQQIWSEIVQLNIDLAAKQGAATNPNFSIEALQKASVGFLVVDIPEAKTKVVSWYILWAEGPPTWVTIVGTRAAGTQPYFSAHLTQLPLLKDKPASKKPF
jgi:hypothetical protein